MQILNKYCANTVKNCTTQDLTFEQNPFIDSGDIGCALCMLPLSVCMYACAKCVCFVVTKQDLKYKLNLFTDSGNIGCAR